MRDGELSITFRDTDGDSLQVSLDAEGSIVVFETLGGPVYVPLHTLHALVESLGAWSELIKECEDE